MTADEVGTAKGSPPLDSGTDALALVSDRIFRPRHTTLWWTLLSFSLAGVGVFLVSVGVLLWKGVGVWGVNQPVGWGLAIVNFVWWIGIGHAGTLISAILYLVRQEWRTGVNRFAETMTIFAVVCAGTFPLLHLGRPWYFYWLIPYPNRMTLWPQWRSPLMWDFFAVSTYLTVSLLFWYLGLVPDFALLRDRARDRRVRRIYGLLALGWRNSNRQWSVYERAYLLLACLATPLVVSVHSIVSLDFAAALVPGWHSTIFPPFFVAGAIFSGFALVTTLVIPARALFGLQDLITRKHLDNMAKFLLLTSLLVTYGYLCEGYMAWYSGGGETPLTLPPQNGDPYTSSGHPHEWRMLVDRFTGTYAPVYYLLLLCNSVLPLLLFVPAYRRHVPLLFALSLAINVGMWAERFIIVVQGLHHDFLPSSWRDYLPTVWDVGLYLGTFGIFFTGMLLFVRFLPMVAISENLKQAAHRV